MHGKLISVQCCTIGTKKIVGINTSIILNKKKKKKKKRSTFWLNHAFSRNETEGFKKKKKKKNPYRIMT